VHVPFPKKVEILQRDLRAIRPCKSSRHHPHVRQFFTGTLDNDLERDRLVSRSLQGDAPCCSIPNHIGVLVTRADSVREKVLIILERLIAYRVDTHRITDGPYFNIRVRARNERSCRKRSAKNGGKKFDWHFFRDNTQYIMPLSTAIPSPDTNRTLNNRALPP
jgi:hypothetical protein